MRVIYYYTRFCVFHPLTTKIISQKRRFRYLSRASEIFVPFLLLYLWQRAFFFFFFNTSFVPCLAYVCVWFTNTHTHLLGHRCFSDRSAHGRSRARARVSSSDFIVVYHIFAGHPSIGMLRMVLKWNSSRPTKTTNLVHVHGRKKKMYSKKIHSLLFHYIYIRSSSIKPSPHCCCVLLLFVK